MNKKTENNNLKKNFTWNMIGTGLYAFTSLLYLIIVTRINGVDDAGIFTFAFSFASMLLMIGIYAGRTYQVTENDKQITQKDFLIFKLMCCLAMLIVGILFSIFRNYDLTKFFVIFILLLFKALDAYAEAIYGVFQKNNNLYQSGISLTLKSILCVIIFLIIDLIFKDLIISVLSILLIDVLVFIFYDIRKLRNYKISNKKFSMYSLKSLLFGGFWVFAFFFLTQYINNAQKYVIDFFMQNADQTIFGIIVMPATFMCLCSQFLFNPFVNDINNLVQKKQKQNLLKLILRLSFWIIAIGIAALIVCYFLGIPVLNWIYGIDLDGLLPHLLIIVLGSIFYALAILLSNVMITIRKNKIQALIWALASIFTFVMSYLLIIKYQLFGACIAYFITMIFVLILYIITLVFIYKRSEIK